MNPATIQIGGGIALFLLAACGYILARYWEEDERQIRKARRVRAELARRYTLPERIVTENPTRLDKWKPEGPPQIFFHRDN